MQTTRPVRPRTSGRELFARLATAFRYDQDLLFRILWAQFDAPDPRLHRISADGVINLLEIWAEVTETRVSRRGPHVLIDKSLAPDRPNLRTVLNTASSMYHLHQDERGLGERVPKGVIVRSSKQSPTPAAR